MNFLNQFIEYDQHNEWNRIFDEIQEKSNYNYSVKIAEASINRERNRYTNVIPYDHNRVRLNITSSISCPQLQALNTNNISNNGKLNSVTPQNNVLLMKRNKKSKWIFRNKHTNLLSRRFNNNNNTANKNNDLYSCSTGLSRPNDYINASFLPLKFCTFEDSPKSPNANHNYSENLIEGQSITTDSYILTQGPLEKTVAHFWQMVWQYKSSIIVMLNKIYEGNSGKMKCFPYLPGCFDDDSCKMFPFTTNSDEQNKKPDILEIDGCKLRVKLLDRKIYPDFIISTLEILDKSALASQTNSSACRTIFHYQYTSWPDFGVPRDPDSFVQFMAIVKKKQADLRSSQILLDKDSEGIHIKMNLIENNGIGANFHRKDLSSTHDHFRFPTVVTKETPITLSKHKTTKKCVPTLQTFDINDTIINKPGGKITNSKLSPIIIHCSAGIGRTGTFCLIDCVLHLLNIDISLYERQGKNSLRENIDHTTYENDTSINSLPQKRSESFTSVSHDDTYSLIDYIIKRQNNIERLNDLNIPLLLSEMRKYRTGLIQTPDQLRFCYVVLIRILDWWIREQNHSNIEYIDSERNVSSAFPCDSIIKENDSFYKYNDNFPSLTPITIDTENKNNVIKLNSSTYNQNRTNTPSYNINIETSL